MTGLVRRPLVEQTPGENAPRRKRAVAWRRPGEHRLPERPGERLYQTKGTERSCGKCRVSKRAEHGAVSLACCLDDGGPCRPPATGRPGFSGRLRTVIECAVKGAIPQRVRIPPGNCRVWTPLKLQAFFESPLFCARRSGVAGSVLRDNGVSMLSRARIEGRARPPRGVNPYIRAPAPTCTYDGRTSRPIPTSPPVSVRTDRGATVPARDSDGRARRTRRPANPCTCRARSMTLILCGGLRKSGQSSTSRS